MSFTDQLQRLTSLVEQGIDQNLPPAETRPTRLHTAMRYSLQAGGKRIRPVMVIAAAEALGATTTRAMPAAVAIECIHTYSLIHDDLPCMDNDDLRRGRPTAHRAFDEATALLAGDALLTHAFALLARAYADDASLARGLVDELAEAAGSRRLIGGQMEDLLAEKRSDASVDDLDFIHRNKTGAMIEAALVMGGLVARAPETQLRALRAIGFHAGLAFQIIDDVLDATADSKTLGKTAGKDAKADKTTFVKLHGVATSREIAAHHTNEARGQFKALPGDTGFLRALVDSLLERKT
jgi:geranylgeranyl diphosphate synthase type II